MNCFGQLVGGDINGLQTQGSTFNYPFLKSHDSLASTSQAQSQWSDGTGRGPWALQCDWGMDKACGNMFWGNWGCFTPSNQDLTTSTTGFLVSVGTAHSIVWSPCWPPSLALEGLHHTWNGVQRIFLCASKVDRYKATAAEIQSSIMFYQWESPPIRRFIFICFSRPSPTRQQRFLKPFGSMDPTIFYTTLLWCLQVAARHWIPKAAEQALPLRKTHAPRLSGAEGAWRLSGQVALYRPDVVAENPDLSSFVRYCALTRYCIQEVSDGTPHSIQERSPCESMLEWCWAHLPGILASWSLKRESPS